MASLGTLTAESARKTARDAAIAAKPDSATLLAEQLARNKVRYHQRITRWCASAGVDAENAELIMRESVLDAAACDLWDTELTAAGYVVTRTDGIFTVTLTPDA